MYRVSNRVCRLLVPQLQISRSRSSWFGVPGFLLQCFGTNAGRGVVAKGAVFLLCVRGM